MGCGERKVRLDEVGLDIIPPCDVLWDLNNHPLPFEDNEFDEIHAYHVLEHIGRQGDWKFFFEEWTEYHRILKPGGIFKGSVPYFKSVWALGDPGHVRVFPDTYFTFLQQAAYKDQVGRTGMADYRSVWKGNFDVHYAKCSDGAVFEFTLIKAEAK
jgi:SAM-dependent methyltransferase